MPPASIQTQSLPPVWPPLNGELKVLPLKRDWLRAMLVCLSIAGLAACSQFEPARLAQERLSARDWEGAVQAARTALSARPEDLSLRAQLRTTLDHAVAALLVEAGNTRESRPDAAAALYSRVLMLEPGNQRALAGLRAVESESVHAALLNDAVRAQQAGRYKEARRKLQLLLAEVPSHAKANALLKSLDEVSGERASDPAGAKILDAYRKRVTIEFKEVNIRTVFDILSRETGINFVFDKDLNRNAAVSIFARNASTGEVLDNILITHGLASRITGSDTVLIYSATQQKQREYQELLVYNFFLENSDAKQIGNLLKSILKVNDLYVDERRNLIVIRDTPEVVDMAVRLIAAHDQPEPEVMLDVEILEVKRSALNELGVRIPDQLSLGIPGDLSLNAARSANGDSIRVTGLDKALILNLKRQAGSTELLANPRIRVRNREKAKIHIGDRVPVITSTVSAVAALTTESVNYLDVGIKLEVEPIIQLEDVQIKASLEVSSIVGTFKTATGSTVYQLGTRNAATTLTLRDGETQVLAGLIQRSERGNSARVPGLGDFPVVGRMFSSEALDSDKTEVLLSITPYMVRSLERPSDRLLQFRAGTDAGRRLGVPVTGALPARVASQAEPASAGQPSPSATQSGRAATASPAPGTAGGGQTSGQPGSGQSATPAPTPSPRFELPPGVGSK